MACKFAAYPALGARSALYRWYPWQGTPPPAWMRFGGWLAGARHWHFALGWFLIGNGIIYLLYMGARGEWRRPVFPPGRDARNAALMIADYRRLRRAAPPIDFYNGLQRLACSSVIPIALVEVLSGLAIYKPVQLWLQHGFVSQDGDGRDHVRPFLSPSILGTGHGNGARVGVRFGERRLPTLRNLPRATVTIRFCLRQR